MQQQLLSGADEARSTADDEDADNINLSEKSIPVILLQNAHKVLYSTRTYTRDFSLCGDSILAG